MIYPKQNEAQFFKKTIEDISPNGRLLYVGNLLSRAARLFNDEVPALMYQDETISYLELYRRASALAKLLKTKGLKPRDRVLVCFENCPEFYVAYFATLQAGAVVAPINTFLKEKELTHIVSDAQPRFIITSADRKPLFEKTDGSTIPIITNEDMPTPDESFVPEDPIELEPDEMAALLYTSGTTGLPKGVMLSSRNIITNCVQGLTRLQIGFKERIFGVLPIFHVFAQTACIWSAFLVGATVILVPKIERRAILSALDHKPTGFLGVPALYGLICLLKTAPLDSVTFFLSGGDAMPDKIRMYFELLYHRKICNGYGLTETSPVIAIDCQDIVQPTNVIGKPVYGIACEIRDEQGNALPAGKIGELWVKGPSVMLGYYNAKEQTDKVLKDGWFNTGDAMYKDNQGKLVITGRTKDLIISKGINIYPQEIENVILSHPNVMRTGVIGKKDDAYGEIPIAYVQLKEEQPGIEAELKTLCSNQLASYKVPRSFICSTKELAMTATGKVDKKLLRTQE